MMTTAMCLALAIYLEAGTENDVGRAAVGWSVINASRTLHKKHNSICEEVFSGRYMGVNNFHNTHLPKDKIWRRSVNTASEILHGKIPDPTHGSQFFECTLWPGCKKHPYWSRNMIYMGRFGSQNFWKK